MGSTGVHSFTRYLSAPPVSEAHGARKTTNTQNPLLSNSHSHSIHNQILNNKQGESYVRQNGMECPRAPRLRQQSLAMEAPPGQETSWDSVVTALPSPVPGIQILSNQLLS